MTDIGSPIPNAHTEEILPAQDDNVIIGDESPSIEPRGSQSISLDPDSRSSSSAEQDNTTNEDVPVRSRVPMAWRYRQAHAHTVESTTAFRGETVHPLHASTLHPQRRNYFKTATAIRSLGPYPLAHPTKSPKPVFPKTTPTDGFQTLPTRRLQTTPVPQLSTSFYRLPKPDIPRSIHARDSREDNVSVGSQFYPPAPMERMDIPDYASIGQFAHYPSGTVTEGATPVGLGPVVWRPPGFFPVAMLPPPFIPGAPHTPPGFTNYSSDSEKVNVTPDYCRGGFVVLWLIVAVIAIGVIVGVAVIFGRRNVLS